MPKHADAVENKSRARRRKRNSFKGALLKGMTQRLPVELIGDLSFEEGLQKILRGYAGVYALYKGERLYYVGLAVDLYNRLRWHTKNKHKGKWDRFAIFSCQARAGFERHGNPIASSR